MFCEIALTGGGKEEMEQGGEGGRRTGERIPTNTFSFTQIQTSSKLQPIYFQY